MIKKNKIFWILVPSIVGLLIAPRISYAAISQVAGQNLGDNGSPSTITFPGNVTIGHQIIVTETVYSATLPSTQAPAMSSGSATIGGFITDATYVSTYDGNIYIAIGIYRALVTGSGSLTITPNVTTSSGYGVVINEYSGMASSPVDGAFVTNTATSATESTGNITTSRAGMIFMASLEDSTLAFSYTQSDTNVVKFENYQSFTFETQHKITNSPGTYNLTAGTGNSFFWIAVGVAYGVPSNKVFINNAKINKAKLGLIKEKKERMDKDEK